MDINKFRKNFFGRRGDELRGCEALIRQLEYQRYRVLNLESMNYPTGLTPVHDVDFYIIILRRLYRLLEKKARTDSRIANLKGKYKELFEKIKIRDHFEHGIDTDKLTPVDASNIPKGQVKASKPVKIFMSLFRNKDEAKVVSGEWIWDLNQDHVQFIKVMEEVMDPRPFTLD